MFQSFGSGKFFENVKSAVDRAVNNLIQFTVLAMGFVDKEFENAVAANGSMTTLQSAELIEVRGHMKLSFGGFLKTSCLRL